MNACEIHVGFLVTCLETVMMTFGGFTLDLGCGWTVINMELE